MKAGTKTRGTIYRCPVCGAEVTVLGNGSGLFFPVCCNVKMCKLPRKLIVYRCPVCGSEIGVLTKTHPSFMPICCNRQMIAA